MCNLSKQSEFSKNVYKPLVLTDYGEIYPLQSAWSSLKRHKNCFDPFKAKVSTTSIALIQHMNQTLY